MYIVCPEVEFPSLSLIVSPLGTIRLAPAYIKFGFAILFNSISLAIVVLYSIASLLRVSPLCIIIVVVPPADGLFVFSGRGISSV